MPKRDTGKDERKHLTALEVEKLLAAVKGARHEARDRCLILLMFRHGLRVSEAVGLKLSDVDLEGRHVHVKWLKRGLSTAHPHMLRHGCGYALAEQGTDTRLIRDYLGQRNIQHTVRYTASNAARFERLWR